MAVTFNSPFDGYKASGIGRVSFSGFRWRRGSRCRADVETAA